MKINPMLLLLAITLCNNVFATNKCMDLLSDADRIILNATKLKIIKPKNPEYPLSLSATKLAVEALKASAEDTVEVGCVTLKFNINRQGSSDSVVILASNPKKIFDRSAILAIKEYIFTTKEDVGIHIIQYKVSRKKLTVFEVAGFLPAQE